MKLSIVNYGAGINVKVPDYAKREDGDLLKIAREIMTTQGYAKGGLLISEVMHTGLTNFNKRHYMDKGMDKAVMSFFDPHVTPFLMHHNDGSGGFFAEGDPNVISVGTNLYAKFFKRKVETATGAASGYVKVATFVHQDKKVGDLNALDALQSRQLLTLSIGAKIASKDYICSICKNPRRSSECTHELGEMYDGVECVVEIYNPFFREYSALYNPADVNAIIRRVEVDDAEGGKIEREEIDQTPGGWNISLYEVSSNKTFSLGGVDHTTREEVSSTQEEQKNMNGNAKAATQLQESVKLLKMLSESLNQSVALLASVVDDSSQADSTEASGSAGQSSETEGGGDHTGAESEETEPEGSSGEASSSEGLDGATEETGTENAQDGDGAGSDATGGDTSADEAGSTQEDDTPPASSTEAEGDSSGTENETGDQSGTTDVANKAKERENALKRRSIAGGFSSLKNQPPRRSLSVNFSSLPAKKNV